MHIFSSGDSISIYTLCVILVIIIKEGKNVTFTPFFSPPIYSRVSNSSTSIYTLYIILAKETRRKMLLLLPPSPLDIFSDQ